MNLSKRGQAGGRARARKLTVMERREAARHAAKLRWDAPGYASRVELDRKDRLLWFIRGWKKGAAGMAMDKFEALNRHFLEGHTAGRVASMKMYERASRRYKTMLSPLRAEKKS